MKPNMSELKKHYDPPKKIDHIIHWFCDVGYMYLPAVFMGFFFLFSLILNYPTYLVIVLGLSSVLMIAGGFFIQIQKHNDDLSPESIFSVPAFIVLPSGEIKSSNKMAAELILTSSGQLSNLLYNDGFDSAAAYRLLNTVQTHSEQNNRYVYKSRLIQNKTILIVRYDYDTHDIQETETQHHTLNNSTHNGDDIIIIDDHFDNLPIGYFETHQGTSDEQSSDNNTIFAMNKKLREWVKKDSELLEHLKKFGSYDTKRSIGVVSLKDKLTPFSSDASKDKILKVFQYFIDKNSDDAKIQGFIMPMQMDNQAQNDYYQLKINTQDNHKNTVSDKTQTHIKHIPDDDLSTKIFQNIPIATVILDINDTIIDYNQAFLDLLELSECTKLSIKDYFSTSEYQKIKNAGNNTPVEIMMTTPKERILSLKICLSNDKNYKICYFNDVSSEKNLEQKFNQAQKMQAIGQLAGGVAHDFNNLLTAILGHTELLMNRFSSSDMTYVDLLQIRNNANRAGNLVRQLLAFSRRQTLKPEIIVLTDILADISRMLERLMGDRIVLNTHYAPMLKPIKADITQLEQVIINLGVNARDAMEHNGGVLTISTENISAENAVLEGHNIMPAIDYVKIIVSDTGHGMSDDTRAKIFEPFFTTKEQGKGTGLGLSTVYGIIKQSDGFIFVDSEVNKGTQFRLYFPVTHEQKKQILTPTETLDNSSADLITHAPHTKTILIVEDEESVRSFAVRALELRGYNILEADCGEDALNIFKTHSDDIHLIITDVMMPGLSGPEWIKEAMKIKDNLKVIFMSGYTQDYFRDNDAFNLEGTEVTFLSKPFSLKNFNDIIQNKI